MTRPLEHIVFIGPRADCERAVATMRPVVDAMRRHGVAWRLDHDFGHWTAPFGEAGGEIRMRRVRTDQILVSKRIDAIAALSSGCFMLCASDLADDGATMADHIVRVMDMVTGMPWNDSETFTTVDDWILGAAAMADPTEHHIGVVDLASPWSSTELEDGMGRPAAMPSGILTRFDERVPMTITISSRFSDGSYRLYVSSTYRWKDPASLWAPGHDPVRTLRILGSMRAAGVIEEDRT